MSKVDTVDNTMQLPYLLVFVRDLRLDFVVVPSHEPRETFPHKSDEIPGSNGMSIKKSVGCWTTSSEQEVERIESLCGGNKVQQCRKANVTDRSCCRSETD